MALVADQQYTGDINVDSESAETPDAFIVTDVFLGGNRNLDCKSVQ